MTDTPADVRLSVVLPSYQEEENLRLLLPRVRAALAQVGGSSEVLVVDTVAPFDATEQLCGEVAVRYVRRTPTNSFGDAVRTGIREARGSWILFMDADGSHGPEWIPKLLAESSANDVVIASRYVDGGATENTWPLVLMSRVLNLSYSLVLGLKVKDVSNSFKLYRADWLKALHLKCENFDVIEEILFKLTWHHPDLRVAEVPSTFKSRMFGLTKRNLVVFILTYAYTIVRLRLSIDEPRKGKG